MNPVVQVYCARGLHAVFPRLAPNPQGAKLDTKLRHPKSAAFPAETGVVDVALRRLMEIL